MLERRDLPGAWRAVDDLRRRMADREAGAVEYNKLVEDLLKSDEIAEAVAVKMKEQQALGLTKVQKRVAVSGAFLGLVAMVANVVLHFVPVAS